MLHKRISLAASFARSWLAYFVDGPPRPLSAAFAITYRCNLRCEYCNTPLLESRELTLPQIEVVLGRLASIGVRRIGYAGGEPLLRPDIGDIVRATREHGFYVTLNTNLTLYRDHAAVFDDLDLVFTSLDGGRAAHTANRGARAWDGVLEAIGALVGRGKRVVAISVITGQNIDELDALLDVAESVGFRIHLQPQTVGAAFARGSRSQDVTDERERRFWALALSRKRSGRAIASSRAYLETLANWADFDVTAFFDPQSRCAAGRGFLHIDPGGDAFPCAYLKGRVQPVNLLENDWRDGFDRRTPCTRCNVGPHLEFNTLYQRPLSSALNVMKSYV